MHLKAYIVKVQTRNGDPETFWIGTKEGFEFFRKSWYSFEVIAKDFYIDEELVEIIS